jgi:hypothetical protein
MTYTTLMLDPKNHKIVGIGSYVLYGLIGVLLLFWGGKALYAGTQISEVRLSIETKNRALMDARKEIQSTGTVSHKVAAVSSMQQASDSFHDEVEEVAQQTGCTVNEFGSGTTLSDYVTKFAATPDPKGYKQIHVSINVTGSLPNLLTMLRRLGERPLPFEYGGVELLPSAAPAQGLTNKQNDATAVTAHVELDLLTRGGA